MIKIRKLKNIEDRIKQVNKLYLQRGLKITCIHADREFEPLRAEMYHFGVSLNWAPKKENVPDIERFNQTNKERVRSDRAAITF